jgi:hypothetical protein
MCSSNSGRNTAQADHLVEAWRVGCRCPSNQANRSSRLYSSSLPNSSIRISKDKGFDEFIQWFVEDIVWAPEFGTP